MDVKVDDWEDSPNGHIVGPEKFGNNRDLTEWAQNWIKPGVTMEKKKKLVKDLFGLAWVQHANLRDGTTLFVGRLGCRMIARNIAIYGKAYLQFCK